LEVKQFKHGCVLFVTCSSNTTTNMFVVDREQFSEITNVHRHQHVSKLFNLLKSHLK